MLDNVRVEGPEALDSEEFEEMVAVSGIGVLDSA